MDSSGTIRRMSSSDIIPAFEDPPSAHSQKDIIADGYRMITRTLREPLFELYCEAELDSSQFIVQFDVFPFSAGGQRLAFEGRMLERLENGRLKSHMPVVVKLQMATGAYLCRTMSERTRVCEVEADNTVRKHEITSSILEKWCSLGTNKQVDILPAIKLVVTRECTLGNIPQEKFPVLHHLFKKLSLDAVLYNGAIGTVEEYLDGKFTKFLNNDGEHNHQVRANFPAAFAHWSWVDSGGTIMVSDIQGVRSGNGYVLTDPCVHSVSGATFGATDLGIMGVEEFFAKHRCNGLCNDLKLAKDGSDLDAGNWMRTRVLKVAAAKEESEDPSVKTRITHEDKGTRERADRVKEKKSLKERAEARLRARSGSARVRRSSEPYAERRKSKRMARPTSFKDLRVEHTTTTAEPAGCGGRTARLGALLALVTGATRRQQRRAARGRAS